MSSEDFHYEMSMKQLKPRDVRNRRAGMGLSPARLAEFLEVAPATVHRWEEGKTRIPLMLDAALKALENTHALDRIKNAVREIGNKTGDSPKVIQVPVRLANEFLGWEADDWAENSGGWLSRDRCRELANRFLIEGVTAIETWGLDNLPAIKVARDIREDVKEVTVREAGR